MVARPAVEPGDLPSRGSPGSSGRCATMPSVIVLHALWSRDSTLCVWGEESSLPAHARGHPGRPPVRPRPRRHPFACDAGLLRKVLAGFGMTNLSEAAVERKLALMLPSSELGPQASPQLLRVVDEHEEPDRPAGRGRGGRGRRGGGQGGWRGWVGGGAARSLGRPPPPLGPPRGARPRAGGVA